MTTASPSWTRSDGSDLPRSRGESHLTEAGISVPIAGIHAADLHFVSGHQLGDLRPEPWCKRILRNLGVARPLGSEADADDVLQEAWLRLSRADAVDDLPAWLTTVVTRLCLDQLRKRRTRSVVEAAVPDEHAPVDPEADALLAEMTGDALQVILEALAPAERAAFVLHDVFGYPFDEVSAVMGRSSTAVRQMASRARRKLQGVPETPASQASRLENQRIVDAFLTAARGGEIGTLLSLLAPNAVMRADLVGQSMGTEPTYEGAEAVAARFNGTRGAMPVTIDAVSYTHLRAHETDSYLV